MTLASLDIGVSPGRAVNHVTLVVVLDVFVTPVLGVAFVQPTLKVTAARGALLAPGIIMHHVAVSHATALELEL